MTSLPPMTRTELFNHGSEGVSSLLLGVYNEKGNKNFESE